MSRYIDSDVAIDKVDCLFRDTERDKGNFMLIGYNHAVADCIAILKSLDAEDKDMVELVRCKDCKWWDHEDDSQFGYCNACKHGHFSKHWEISIYRKYKADWYCADGERKG